MLSRRGGTFVLTVILSCLLLPAFARAGYVPGEVIVSLRADAPHFAAANLPGVESARPVGRLPDVRLLELEPGETVAGAVARLGARGDVAYAQPNWIYRLKSIPNDPMFGQLWGLRNRAQNVYDTPDVTGFGIRGIDSGAWKAWRLRTGGKYTVGVIDSGIASDHPDLNRNLDRRLSRNFAPTYPGGPTDPEAWDDPHGHGTHVAGTIGAVGNNGLGVVGVNWRTRLVALRVCSATGECEADDMAAAIDYAGRKGVRVVNMSIGSEPGDPYSANRVVIDAIRRYPKMLFVTAAGNESSNNDRAKEWPCSARIRNMICVAAIDPKGKLPYFTNWGRRTVDIAAPGQFIASTWINKVFPLDDVFFRDGLDGWRASGWVEASAGGMPELRYQGKAGQAWARPGQSFDLREMRYCRAGASLAGMLSGNQTITVQYRIDDGAWIDAANGMKADEMTIEEADHSFYLPEAGGNPLVELRVLYRSGGTKSPEPLVRMSSIDLTCVKQMPPGGMYRQLEGTSMASPHVAGVAALARAVYPKLTGVKLKRVVLRTGRKMPSLKKKTVTGRRVDAGRAVLKARKLKARQGRG